MTPSGHFDAAEDVSWEPKDGSFVVSVSRDQTSRLHSCWQGAPPATSENLTNAGQVLEYCKPTTGARIL